MEYRVKYDSPIGILAVEADESALTGVHLCLEATPDFASDAQRGNRITTAACCWLDEYFSGRRPSVETLPVRLSGSAFSLKVWELLRKIPYGKVVSYGQIAENLRSCGVKACAQAVGGAVGKNPVMIIVPCHRVVGKDMSMIGFGRGTDKIYIKEKLLVHEGFVIKNSIIANPEIG